MGLSCTVSEINDDFSQKSQIFPPGVFNATAEGVSLEAPLGVKKTRTVGLPVEKKLDDIFSRLDTRHERDTRTDRRTVTGRQQRPRLRTASRGKKLR